MNIGDTRIGARPYIIAELGVNHDGSEERALELTRAAADAGADAVKLQYFEADRLMSRAAKLAAYQKAAGERDPVEMLRRLELPIEAMGRVADLAHELGLHAIVTVFSLEHVPAAAALPWDAFKSASPDIVNRPLLDAMARTGRPLIVSTGASAPEEVSRAVGWLRPYSGRVALLQCVSSYPTPPEHAELAGIAALRAFFAGPVGYSDHTPGTTTGFGAASLGAEILEKHVTLDRAAPGPDHAASLEPEEFARYARAARDPRGALSLLTPDEFGAAMERIAAVRAAVADAVLRTRVQSLKRVLPIERDVRRVSRQSLVATADLPAGHTLRRTDLTIKRPGTGLAPHELDTCLGRRLCRAVTADTPLLAENVEALVRSAS
ncbi:MAG: N-acetylneuraminate synthase family protein [Phycisphaerae bacterium]|nr:N-acetylneuraminate synthase family protein [Phycisphaerae bacterium]